MCAPDPPTPPHAAGTPVWFIIKKIRHEENRMVWAFVPFPGAGAPATPVKGDDYHGVHPSPEDMCWEETDRKTGVTTVHMGEAVFVGSLGHNVGDIALDPDRRVTQQGIFQTGNHTMPPTTELFVRI